MFRTLSSTLKVTALGLALSASTAQAAGFQAKTMRAPFSAREIERGLVLGKGWVEINLGTDVKNATGYWGADGTAEDFTDARWLYTTQSLNGRYGITQRGELFWKVKTHYVALDNDALGTEIRQFGLGDPEFGYTFEFFRSLAPLTSAVGYARYKAPRPLGNESPGNYVGAPNTLTAIIMTTGTPDITVGTAFKRQFGPGAVVADLGYIFRASGAPLYMLETEYNQFQMRIKPGSIVRLKVDGQVQASIVALQAGIDFQQRAATRIGPASGGLVASRNLEAVEGSEGWALDIPTKAIFHVTQTIDLEAGARIPVRGEDLDFWPIEDIHPTRGITYTGSFEFRY